MASLEDSKRIKALRRDIVAAIPRFPNDKASLQALEGKKLTELLISYIGWKLRLVARRSRQVVGEGTLGADPRATALKPNIETFLAAIRKGDDLLPYISLEAATRGYTPVADPKSENPNLKTWADEDFLLNIMGLHHFHLGLTREAAGHMARTSEVLFASVTRGEFEIIGLFDHAAFEHEQDGSMTPERIKLWSAYTAREQAGLLPGQMSIGGFNGLGVTPSSHPVQVVLAAQRHVKILREIDPKLDDPPT